MLKFGIMSNLVPNLTLNLAFAKFNTRNNIELEDIFFFQILNFSIITFFLHYIGDALSFG